MTTTCNAILKQDSTYYPCAKVTGHYRQLDSEYWHTAYDTSDYEPIIWSDKADGAGYASPARASSPAAPVSVPPAKPKKPQIEVWLRTSGWGIPHKVGIADLGTDAPSTFRNLAGLLRNLADIIEPLGKAQG